MLLTAIILLLCSMVAKAQSFLVDGIYYNVTDDVAQTVEVVYGYDAETIIIPASVVYNNTTYTVTSIGGAAFSYDQIKSVVIGENVSIIKQYAFSTCANLESVVIGENVSTIGQGAFFSCSNLTSIKIPNSVTAIGESAFCSCSSLTSIEISDNVTTIGERAFQACSSLTSIDIPHSVTTIGDQAFGGCSSLTSLTIGNNVTNISNGTLWGCSSLTSLTIGNSVTDIDWGTFSDCTRLTNITFNCKNIGNWFMFNETIKNVIVSDNVTTISVGAFEGCSSLTSIEIPNSVTAIGWGAFSGCSSLTSIEIPNSIMAIDAETFTGCSSLTSIKIPNSVTTIGMGAFDGCLGLTSIEIPNNVTTIGDKAFRGCKLKSLTIGSGVLSIGSNQCKPTKTIWLTNTPPSGYNRLQGKLNYVANDLYSELSNLNVYPYLSSMFEKEGVKYVPVSPSERTCDAIDCCYDSSTTYINICETVSYKGVDMVVHNVMPYIAYGHTFVENVNVSRNMPVGESAFNGCSSLSTLSLGDGITSIGVSAFKGCKSLKEVVLPNGITSLGDYCFSGCGLSSIKIPSSVTSIGNYTFSECTALANVIIEDRTTDLALGSNGSASLFADCPLNSVYIGGNISYNTSKEYGYSPFYRNTSLRTVVITDKEEEISDNEFYGCANLKNVTVGGDVKIIGNWAFSGCSNLEAFSLGPNVESIGEEAFSDCYSLIKFISEATTPPTCGAMALDDINKWNCTLMVPVGAKSVYQSANQWKDFFFVEDIPASINDVVIDDENAPIYNLNGTRVDNTSELQKGIYIKNGKKFFIK